VQVSRLKRLVMAEVKLAFKPELINRFDETLVFQRLGR
jgi:ATP-dependent Clp protease ATP-binding subunit ClpA